MYEVIPLVTGVLLGLFVGSTGRTRASTLLVAAVAVVVGFLAASISGELEMSWAFVVFDVGQVLVAYVLALSASRMLARSAGLRRPR